VKLKRNFSLFHRGHHIGSGVHPVSCLVGTGGSFPRIKASINSPPSSTEVNPWIFTFIAPYVFMAWCLFQQRDNFTFTKGRYHLEDLGGGRLLIRKYGLKLRIGVMWLGLCFIGVCPVACIPTAEHLLVLILLWSELLPFPLSIVIHPTVCDRSEQPAYEEVSISFRTGCLERELQMVQLSATGCSCIVIL
jgi:hypothetical protein